MGLFPSPLRRETRLTRFVECLAGRVEPMPCLLQSFGLQRRGGLEQRRGIAVLDHAATLRQIVEVGHQAVEVALRERIELVVVTTGTTHGQAQPDRGCRFHAIRRILHQELLENDSALRVRAMVPVESGGDQLVECRLGQQIAGKLINREPIKWHVVVQRADHPIAPPPHVARAVGLVSAGIGKASGVEPRDRHPLAVVGRTEQAIDSPFVCVRRGVVKERRNFAGRGRQAYQIERHAAQQGCLVGLPLRRQSGAFQVGQDEIVDRVAAPRGLRDRRQRGPLGRHKRPVLLPIGALVDPAADQRDLPWRKLLARIGRRHLRIRVVAGDSFE